MILGARRSGLGQGGRRAAHVEAPDDRGGKGAGGERQRRDGRTSAREAPARRTDVGGGHRRRDVGEGDAGAAREMSVRRAPARRTPARRQTREGDAGGGTSATGTPRRRGSARAIGRRPYRGPYVRERTDAGGGRRRKDSRAGVVLVAQVHARMEAGTGGTDQGKFAWGGAGARGWA